MSLAHRIRTGLIACCVAGVAVAMLAPAAGAAKIGGTYLALGDSLAYGYHAAQFEEQYAKGLVEPSTFEKGYVNDFAAALKLVNPSLKVIDYGCPGETSETFIDGPVPAVPPTYAPYYCAGGKTGKPFPKTDLHNTYPGTQLEAALSTLKANPNVSPITLDIGANDLLQFLATECGFPSKDTCGESQFALEFGKVATNVYLILSQLHAAAPNAQIVLVGIYDPYPTTLPSPGADKDLAEFNTVLAGVAAKVPDTSFANPEPLFNPSLITGQAESTDLPTICALTAMCPGGTFNPLSPKADIHPTTLGYAVMAGVLGVDFLTH